MAAEEAVAPSTDVLDDAALCALRLPSGSFREKMADCSACSSVVICASALLWLSMEDFWFCTWVMVAWSPERAAATNALTSMPWPRPVEEAEAPETAEDIKDSP